MYQLNINGRSHPVDVEPDTPCCGLSAKQVGLTGTKYGCGIGAVRCVLRAYQWRSAAFLLDSREQRESRRPDCHHRGLSRDSSHPCRRHGRQLTCPSAVFCQSGQIMRRRTLKTSPSHRQGYRRGND